MIVVKEVKCNSQKLGEFCQLAYESAECYKHLSKFEEEVSQRYQ
jgi:hypothetical protein